uniref:Uncharacterized protein n=1 Tax=Fagus sylvatica TaxID=28930 RepID=A0A2N9GXW9_FAGSY
MWPFVDFVVGLVVGHDGVAGGCAFRWVWLLCLVVVVEVKVEVGVVAGDYRWPAMIVGFGIWSCHNGIISEGWGGLYEQKDGVALCGGKYETKG